MVLVLNGNQVEGPLTREAIADAIRSLTGEGDSFVILSRNEMSYIQTAGCAASGYVLEYQEGSIEKHFSCEDPDLDEDTIIDIFQRYFDNDSRWKTDRRWTPVDLGYERKRTAAWPIAGVIGLIFLFVLWRYFTATT